MQYELKIRNPLATFLKYAFLILCIIIVNLVVMYGINCADADNCLRDWCKTFNLKRSYREFIAENCVRNK